ncbi:MAG: UDP-N-acetylmuramoyl-tripeptide--D-alanyl-D-alanine ligase, partial [bacterium]|nr:UDP-N-acetylmuramoyl-tripeptide--D-alanyl-D-alanine ligase [bacterium]
ALTGSNGKTTTKEMLRCMLGQVLDDENFSVNNKSFNNNFGVPLSALQVTKLDKVAVFEMGMNRSGEITELCQITNPQIALITNIGLAHSGFLGGIKGVAAAKGELYKYLSSNDIAIVNADDKNCVQQSAQFSGKKITFGQTKAADIYLEKAIPNWNKTQSADYKTLGMDLVLIYQHKKYDVFLPLLGVHNALNAAAAFAVMTQLNLDLEQAVLGLKRMQAVYGRLHPSLLINGAITLDDSYNASPESFKAAIKLLSSFSDKRKIAVLGEMTEQGENTKLFHENIGAFCHEHNIDLLFTFGKNTQAYIDGAIKAGMSEANCFWAPNQKELAIRLASITRSNDIILFKGSRFSQTEKVLEDLTFLQQKSKAHAV